MENYVDLTRYIRSFPTLGAGYRLRPFKKLLRLLDNPEQQMRGLHIVGTNGKGSTAALCQSILRQTGLRIGLYSSPHIQSYRERIQINGQWISEHDFVRLIKKLKQTIEKNFKKSERLPTWFEVLTAAAFLYFQEKKCNLVVLEAGLGGKLDATNVTHLGVIVIPSISKDHTRILGASLEKITRDKAAVIKKNTVVVTSSQLSVVSKKIIQDHCKKKKAEFFVVRGELQKLDWTGTTFSLRVPQLISMQLKTTLIGTAQAQNGAVAVAACTLLSKRLGFNLTQQQIRTGLFEVKWSGRFEVIKPVLAHWPQGTKLILDGAHNVAGIEQLVLTIKKIKKPQEKIAVIFQCMADKEYTSMLQKLKTIADGIVFTTVLNILPRAMSGEKLHALFPWGRVGKDFQNSLSEANTILDGKGMVVICGSLYLVGQFRKYIVGTKENRNSPDSLLHNTDAVGTH